MTLMQFDSSEHHFVESSHGSAFFPWGHMMLVGALWAYSVLNESMRQSLVRLVRLYHIVSFAFFAMVVVIGVYCGYAMLAMWIGVVVPPTVYSALAFAKNRKLTRVTTNESLQVLATRFDDVRLVQGVLLGVLSVISAVVFGMHSLSLFPFAAFFGVNAGLSTYVLLHRRAQ